MPEDRVRIIVVGPEEDAALARKIVREAMAAAGWPSRQQLAASAAKPELRVIRGGGDRQ